MSEERVRRAEKAVADLCDQRDFGADLDSEIRGAAVVAVGVGVSIDWLAEITGAPPEEIRVWVRDYRERAATHRGID